MGPFSFILMNFDWALFGLLFWTDFALYHGWCLFPLSFKIYYKIVRNVCAHWTPPPFFWMLYFYPCMLLSPNAMLCHVISDNLLMGGTFPRPFSLSVFQDDSRRSPRPGRSCYPPKPNSPLPVDVARLWNLMRTLLQRPWTIATPRWVISTLRPYWIARLDPPWPSGDPPPE